MRFAPPMGWNLRIRPIRCRKPLLKGLVEGALLNIAAFIDEDVNVKVVTNLLAIVSCIPVQGLLSWDRENVVALSIPVCLSTNRGPK
jgi:hypothetical protein